MAEPLTPFEEGRRIAREYLSKRGWVREWRRNLNTQLYPTLIREEFEEKLKRCDQLEEEAETLLSSAYEQWRKDDSSAAKEVLRGILELLGQRNDLGFFGKRIIDRLKVEFPS